MAQKIGYTANANLAASVAVVRWRKISGIWISACMRQVLANSHTPTLGLTNKHATATVLQIPEFLIKECAHGKTFNDITKLSELSLPMGKPRETYE